MLGREASGEEMQPGHLGDFPICGRPGRTRALDGRVRELVALWAVLDD